MAHSQHAAHDVATAVYKFFYSIFNIDIQGPPLNFQELQRNPLMIVSTHRSHVDYFLLGTILYHMGIRNMRFAAGDNLTKLPWIGDLFTKLGAFTVERDTGFERFYVRNLCEEVVKMLQKHEPVIVFPEGGRSYSGVTLDVKAGILSAAILHQARNPDKEVYLLPAAVSYDYAPDVPWFRMLLAGKRFRKRTSGSFKRFLGNALYFGADFCAFAPFFFARRLKRQYGAAYIDYLQPIPLSQIINLEEMKSPGARDEFSAHRKAMIRISSEMHKRFITLYRILPIHLLSLVLIRNKPLTYHQASLALEPLLDKIKPFRNCRSVNSLSPREIVEEGARQLLRLKAISITHGLMAIRKNAIVDYYAATLM